MTTVTVDLEDLRTVLLALQPMVTVGNQRLVGAADRLGDELCKVSLATQLAKEKRERLFKEMETWLEKYPTLTNGDYFTSDYLFAWAEHAAVVKGDPDGSEAILMWARKVRDNEQQAATA
jgi:ribonuclease HII